MKLRHKIRIGLALALLVVAGLYIRDAWRGANGIFRKHTVEFPIWRYQVNECSVDFRQEAVAGDTDAVRYRVDGEVDGGLAISAFAGKGTITFRMCNQTAREITQQTPVRIVWRLQANPWKWGVEGLTKKDDRKDDGPFVTPPIIRKDAQGRKYVDCRGRVRFPDDGRTYICEDEEKLPPMKQERK